MSANSAAVSQVPLELIKYNARVYTATNGRRGSNLYLDRRLRQAGEKIGRESAPITIPRQGVVVFSDDEPLKNWGHRCRYLIADPIGGNITEDVPATFPPVNQLPEYFEPFHMPTIFATNSGPKLPLDYLPTRVFANAATNWYAILFSGLSNNRHVNDLEFLYRTLVNSYGFPAANVTVLNFDGTLMYNDQNWKPYSGPIGNWPGNDTPYQMKISGAGTKAALMSTIAGLANILGPNSNLLLHTNNHGDTANGVSTLVCYQGDDVTPSDLQQALQGLPQIASLMVMMEQCYSGGFIPSTIAASTAKCTSIATAVDENNVSDGGPDFDPFALAWISAMAGTEPDGTSVTVSGASPAGVISASAAFAYAVANDTGRGDNPQFGQNSNCGAAVTLNDNRISNAVPASFRFLLPPVGDVPKNQPLRLDRPRLGGINYQGDIVSSLSVARTEFRESLRNLRVTRPERNPSDD